MIEVQFVSVPVVCTLHYTLIVLEAMVNTRNTSTTRQVNEAMAVSSDSDVNTLLETLPEDHKILIKVITDIITTRLSD